MVVELIFSAPVLILLGVYIFIPDLTLAQDGLVTCNGLNCNFCTFAEMIDNVADFLVAVLTIIGTIILAITGIQMAHTAAGNGDARQILKDRMTNIILGFFIIIASWTLVDVLLKSLLTDSLKDNWRKPIAELCGGQTPTQRYNPDRLAAGTVPASDLELGNYDYEFTTEVLNSGSYETDLDVGADGMVQIPGEEEKATPDTVARFVAMRAAAAADGITLTVNDGWRSDERQLEYWLKYGCDTNPANCSGKVARPMSQGGHGSNHNRGIALDLNTPYGSRAFNWMKQNGGKYGFYNNLGAGDPWHWSPSGR